MGQALDDRVKGWLEKVGDGVTLSAGGIDDAVQRGLEEAVGPPVDRGCMLSCRAHHSHKLHASWPGNSTAPMAYKIKSAS